MLPNVRPGLLPQSRYEKYANKPVTIHEICHKEDIRLSQLM